jgi:hypothetical protein
MGGGGTQRRDLLMHMLSGAHSTTSVNLWKKLIELNLAYSMKLFMHSFLRL